MSEELDEKAICRSLAKLYAGMDWHRLSPLQRDLVADLERLGYLLPNPGSGFVGKAS